MSAHVSENWRAGPQLHPPHPPPPPHLSYPSNPRITSIIYVSRKGWDETHGMDEMRWMWRMGWVIAPMWWAVSHDSNQTGSWRELASSIDHAYSVMISSNYYSRTAGNLAFDYRHNHCQKPSLQCFPHHILCTVHAYHLIYEYTRIFD